MQRRNQENPRASWRKSTRQPNTGVTSAQQFGAQGRNRRRRLFQLSSLTALVLSLLGIGLYILFLRPDPDVPLIVAAITESSADSFIPPNPFTQEDIDLFEEWFDQNKNQNVVFQADVFEDLVEVSNADSLINGIRLEIERAKPGGPDDDMIAVCVTAQGLVHENRPYLLVGNSRPDDESTWVSVEDLIDVIDKALEKKKCRTVLFLDANRVGTMWDWGKLDHSFVKQCEPIAKGVEDRIAIIVSCRDGQRSWWDPRQGVGLFARAIARAFAGHPGIDRHGDITVGELESFLASQVSSDSETNWEAPQHPKLISDCASWNFIATPDWIRPPNDDRAADIVGPINEKFDQIDELWVRHEQVKQLTHSPLTTDPMKWAILEKKLARLDQLALAGKGSDRVFAATRRHCDILLDGFERGPAAVRSESFPELRLKDYFFEDAKSQQIAQLKTIFDDWKKKADVNDIRTGMVNDDQQQTRNDDQQEAILVSLFWPWLRDEQGSADTAYQFLTMNQIESSPEFLETHLIRLLAAPDLKHVGKKSAVVLELHDSGRDAVFPPDIRASFWIRPDAKRLDIRRMKLIDRILGQGEEADVAAEQTAVKRDSDRLIKFGEEISDAYELRDQLLHEIPRMAETLLADPGAFSDDGKSSLLLKQATEKTRMLNEQLRLIDSVKGGLALDQQRITKATANARRVHGKLRGKLNVRADQVARSKADDGSGFRQVVAMLSGSGLNQAKQRAAIHARIVSLLSVESGNIESEQGSSTDRESQPVTTEADDFDDQLLIDGWHPWTYWLDQIGGSADRPEDEEQSSRNDHSLLVQGESIRSDLKQLQSETFDEIRKGAQKLADKGESLAKVRHDVADLDRHLRGKLFLLGGRDAEVENATRDRFKLDLQLFLMDHAERTMREFWCEARSGESPPYFVEATRDLLDVNSFQATDFLDGVNLEDRRTALAKIAENAEALKAYTEARDTDLESIQAMKRIAFTFPIPESLPDGIILVSDGDKDRQTVPTRETKSNIDIKVPESFSENNSLIAVDTFFRGLRRAGGLEARDLGDPDTVVFELPSYGPPTAKVTAEKMFPNIILVFDCSLSMKGSRMEKAKAAIKDLINALPPRSKVGLIMYGHRFMWDYTESRGPTTGRLTMKPKPKDSQGKYLVIKADFGRNRAQRRVSPDDRIAGDNPNFDTEEVAKFQLLNDAHRKHLLNAISNATSFGMTPTYKAISAAYAMRGRSPCRIVLLTDGKPNLFRGKANPGPALNAFKAAGRGSLTIINYAQNAGLKSIFPGAKFIDANQANIGAVLSGLIPSEEVVWKTKSGNGTASKTEKFNTRVPISQWPPEDARIAKGKPVRPTRDYHIEAGLGETKGKTKVVVEGGEAFQLKLKNNRLSHVPYADLKNKGGYEKLSINRSDAEYSVFVGNAHRDGGGTLNLPLVIENRTAEKFTPRPSEVWIDIVAQHGGQKHRYVISLAEYAANEPVPVLKCRIKDWPNTRRARIDAWIRFDAPKSEGTELSLDGKEQTPFDYVNLLVEQQSEEHSDGTTHHVIVTEKYPDARDMHRLRVLPSPLPDRAEIKFYPAEEKRTEAAGDRLVKRIFHYKEKPEDLRLWAKDKDQITKGAIRASKDIEINL